MSRLHEGKEDIGFVEPEGLQRVSVDRVSGLRPGELSSQDPNGSQVYRELFIPGTAPTDTDDSHVTVEVCLDNEEHVLATEYCANTASVVLRTRLDEYEVEETTDKHGNPLLTEDYLFTVPHKECEIHDATNLTVDASAAKVIQTFGGGEIYFIRDYNLLLEDGTFKFIPKDSQVLVDQTIVLPNGEQIMRAEYNVLYITKPETQTAEIFRRTQEQNANEEDSTEVEDTDNN